MTSSTKVKFIEAYFAHFHKKLDRLLAFQASNPDEALILCVVYIDWLASGRYFDGKERNNENFCRALRELSGDAFFGVIHPAKLMDQAGAQDPTVQTFMQSIVQECPKQFFPSVEIDDRIRASDLPQHKKTSLLKNLWRASVAAICYERIRCPAVHGPGSSSLSFGEIAYNGEVGIRIDFSRLHNALLAVFKEIETASVNGGEWFGNSKYR